MAAAASASRWFRSAQTSYVKACAWCRRIHQPDGSWSEQRLTPAQLDPSSTAEAISHGMCPACERSLMEALNLQTKS